MAAVSMDAAPPRGTINPAVGERARGRMPSSRNACTVHTSRQPSDEGGHDTSTISLAASVLDHFEDCAAWQLPVGVVNDGLWGYLLVSIVTAVCFLRGRIRAGYALLVLVNIIRVLVMLLDYRLRANQHYMLNWVPLG